MGYYTFFYLKWYEKKNIIGVPCGCKIIEDLNEISGYCFVKGKNEGEADSDEIIKWYEYERDMRKLSKKHPRILFELTGEGEESKDLWKARFKNGESEIVKAIVTFPKFEKVVEE